MISQPLQSHPRVLWSRSCAVSRSTAPFLGLCVTTKRLSAKWSHNYIRLSQVHGSLRRSIGTCFSALSSLSKDATLILVPVDLVRAVRNPYRDLMPSLYSVTSIGEIALAVVRTVASNVDFSPISKRLKLSGQPLLGDKVWTRSIVQTLQGSAQTLLRIL
jgi:hypothetical protein